MVALPTERWGSRVGGCKGGCDMSCRGAPGVRFSRTSSQSWGLGKGWGVWGAPTRGHRLDFGHGDGHVCPCLCSRHGSPKQSWCLKQKPACRTPEAPRSQSQQRTLMYCCPISAFNWCPLGLATRERGRQTLSQQALPACKATNR